MALDQGKLGEAEAVERTDCKLFEVILSTTLFVWAA